MGSRLLCRACAIGGGSSSLAFQLFLFCSHTFDPRLGVPPCNLKACWLGTFVHFPLQAPHHVGHVKKTRQPHDRTRSHVFQRFILYSTACSHCVQIENAWTE